jgi:hypothetical protein
VVCLRVFLKAYVFPVKAVVAGGLGYVKALLTPCRGFSPVKVVVVGVKFYPNPTQTIYIK